MSGERAQPESDGAADVASLFSDEERAAIGGAEWAVCVATFYEDLAERLVNGSYQAFTAAGAGAASVRTFEVPGAFELPLAAKLCAEAGDFAGVAATRRRVEFGSTAILRIRDGMIAAAWDQVDVAGLMAQLTSE